MCGEGMVSDIHGKVNAQFDVLDYRLLVRYELYGEGWAPMIGSAYLRLGAALRAGRQPEFVPTWWWHAQQKYWSDAVWQNQTTCRATTVGSFTYGKAKVKKKSRLNVAAYFRAHML